MFLVTSDRIGAAPPPEHISRPPPLPHDEPYQLVTGEPLILQLRVDVADPEAPQKTQAHYVYVALRPSAADPDGRVIAASGWPVECGPPPKPGDVNYGAMDDERSVTNHPRHGLVMDGASCHPRHPDDLRRAAASATDGDIFALKWVRDASPKAPGGGAPGAVH
jgi:hypothetical protein